MRKIMDRFSYTQSMTGVAFLLLRHYKAFKETYKFLQKSQWWSKEELKKYQFGQLSQLLEHAYENVPYYRNLFNKEGLKPEEVREFEDLQKLPPLTKEIIRENIQGLKAKNYPDYKFEYGTTGGSTGLPLGFYLEKGISYAKQMAFAKTLMDRVNCRFRERSVKLLGNEKIWEYQLFGRTLVLSSFHLTEEIMQTFVKKIKKLKPKHIWAYPSAITILANYMKQNNLGFFPSVKTIFCYGETLYEWQRQLIEEIYRCKIFGYYGNLEHTVLAGTCEKSNWYHIFPEYCIVELIGKDGKPINKEGGIGEIVTTSLTNFIFPFIRYKTGDIGVYTNQSCTCGRNYPLLKKIEGRVQEFAISKSNHLVSITGVYGLVAKASQNVKEIQLYQDTPGKIILRVVKVHNYTDNDTSTIIQNFQKRLGDIFDISIQYVDEIPRTTSGKYRFIIQRLPVHFSSD